MIFKSIYPDVTIPVLPFTQFVFQNAAANPDKAALIDGLSGRTLTYGQLVGAIRLVAASLHQRGFQKGDVFAICSPNIPEYAIAFHAVALLGGVVTTMNPLYTADEIANQLNDCKARFIVTVPPFIEKVTAAQSKSSLEEIFVFGEAEGATPFASLLQSDGVVPDVSINPKEDLVVLPYSSGTTGLPKGVMLTHYNLTSNICQISINVNFNQDDTMIGILPFFHIYGMIVVMNFMLQVGGTIVTMPQFDLENFLKIMQDYKVTRACLVPPIILALAKHPLVNQYDLSHLNQIFSGAAPLSAELQAAAATRLKCNVVQGYGLTETSPVTHATPNDISKIKVGSVGPSVPNTETALVEVGTGKFLAAHQEGEIWLRGPQVMKGYLNNAGATAAMIDADGWLHTGDIGYADEDGYLYVVDRVKELIKYKGMQVAPAELEGVLLRHEAIADAAVIGIPDEEAGELPKAYVVVRQGKTLTEDEIMQFVASQVAPHKKIRRVEFVAQVPKSASGKILRRVLKDQEKAKLAAQ
jgi:acyl-CoA synthetase (AMP-forming)/AMP-acid ligase II